MDLTKFEGHTPGPWRVEHEFNVVAGNSRGIASCGGYNSNTDNSVHAANIANAALVAAAPDLLAENKRLREFVEYCAEYSAGELIEIGETAQDLLAELDRGKE